VQAERECNKIILARWPATVSDRVTEKPVNNNSQRVSKNYLQRMFLVNMVAPLLPAK